MGKNVRRKMSYQLRGWRSRNANPMPINKKMAVLPHRGAALHKESSNARRRASRIIKGAVLVLDQGRGQRSNVRAAGPGEDREHGNCSSSRYVDESTKKCEIGKAFLARFAKCVKVDPNVRDYPLALGFPILDATQTHENMKAIAYNNSTSGGLRAVHLRAAGA